MLPPACVKCLRLDHTKVVPGFVVLLSVLIVAVVGSVIAAALLLRSISAAASSITLRRHVQARHLAAACAEEGLQRLRESVYYSGAITIAYPGGSCSIISITGTGNANRILEVTADAAGIRHRIRLTLARLHPRPVLIAWEEITP